MLPEKVSAVEAHRLASQGALIVDVREDDEWAEGHVAGSKLIPLDTVPTRLAEIPKNRDVILICRSGVRSGNAQTFLLGAGYEHVANLEGGILAWAKAGLPVET